MDKIAEAIQEVAKQWKRTNDIVEGMAPQYAKLLKQANRLMRLGVEKIEEED